MTMPPNSLKRILVTTPLWSSNTAATLIGQSQVYLCSNLKPSILKKLNKVAIQAIKVLKQEMNAIELQHRSPHFGTFVRYVVQCQSIHLLFQYFLLLESLRVSIGTLQE